MHAGRKAWLHPPSRQQGLMAWGTGGHRCVVPPAQHTTHSVHGVDLAVQLPSALLSPFLAAGRKVGVAVAAMR